MCKMSWRMTFVILALAVAGCGAQNPEPPQVRAFYPQDGYRGFKRGEAIKITFSEAMDTAATEAAFQLLDPRGAPVAVIFTWEDGGRRLLAAPANPLAYSPDDRYLNYRYLLSTGAKSQAGAPLENGLDVSFSTMRTLTVVRDSVAALDGSVSDLGFVSNDPNDISAYPVAPTGDSAGNRGVRSFFAFGLAGLGFGAEEVAYARINLYNIRLDGAPFGAGNLGSIIPERVEYLDNSVLDKNDYGLPGKKALDPIVSWPASETVTLTVTDWLRQALTTNEKYLQLRLRFERRTDGDTTADAVNVATGEDTAGHRPRLEIGYYAP